MPQGVGEALGRPCTSWGAKLQLPKEGSPPPSPSLPAQQAEPPLLPSLFFSGCRGEFQPRAEANLATLRRKRCRLKSKQDFQEQKGSVGVFQAASFDFPTIA